MLKDSVKLRFLFIELLAWWQGCVQNKDVVSQFAISRQQAYQDLKDYQNTHPDNLVHTPQGYVPSANFCAHYISLDVEQFLSWFANKQLSTAMTSAANVEVLSPPGRYISANVMRVLVGAIKQNKRVEVGYVSLSNPEYDGRIFHPQTFVFACHRWHVRGYCEKSQGYRDLVLSRFSDEAELLDESCWTHADDAAWNKTVEIILQPDFRLSEQQVAVLMKDYNLSEPKLVISTRAALVSYQLQQLNIKPTMVEMEATAQQWTIVNLADIKPWLF
ncbi:WYL domain-containing protein [Shewanella sp. WXL01]|uniref:WYL domain-containing protein n=1 Tax=Shewanella sp. WXL01 TaxID=2709721 RepID=UPI0014383FEB|nr:WYL domain-containing protein [Shewanella sp. WXL01]NKF51191.1 WYL domain-containing protein [Shewanella sp. WXL01]